MRSATRATTIAVESTPIDHAADDAAVAALPYIAPDASAPTSALRALTFISQALKFVFLTCILSAVLIQTFGSEQLHLDTHVVRAVYVAAAVQLALYVIVVCFALSTSAQGWITFGHPAKNVGVANSGGPFDRGATVLGMRDYSRPADVGLPHARSVRVRAPGGADLGAWHVLPSQRARDALDAVLSGTASEDAIFDAALRRDAASARGSGAVAAIYLHGNFESRSKWVSVEHARLLSSHFGLHVVAFDYRGFADSSGGPPTPQTIVEDAHAVVDWLAARGVPPSRVLLYGHSLGTGAAAQLARRLHDQGTPACAAVLEAPFYSLRAAALTFPAAVPLLALPGARRLVLRAFMGGCRSADALAALPSLPLLVLHGDDDTTVPISHSVALARRVRASREQGAGSQGGDEAPQRGGAWFKLEVLRGCDHLQAIFFPEALAAISRLLGAVAGK